MYPHIKDIREDRDKLQKELAEYLNVKQTTYSKYETAQRKPELDVIMKLASLYNVSVDDFLKDFFAEKPDKVTPLATASAPSSKDNKEIFSLSDDEKQLLFLYRDCIRKNEAIEKVREIWLSDAEIKTT